MTMKIGTMLNDVAGLRASRYEWTRTCTIDDIHSWEGRDMATRVTWELTGEERRKLARDLMVELVTELEEALLSQRERQAGTNREELKNLIREVLLETMWEVEQRLPDPDEELTLRPETAERLQTAQEEQTVSLEAVRKELGLDE